MVEFITALAEEVADFFLIVESGHLKRIPAIVVLRVEVGIAVNEKGTDFDSFPPGGLVKRSLAVVVPRLDIGPQLEEGTAGVEPVFAPK